LYENLHLWGRLIDCCVALGRKEKVTSAARHTRSALSPLFLCASTFVFVRPSACFAIAFHLVRPPSQAEELILQQLESNPNDGALWCHLGDVRKDPELYKKSWEMSGEELGFCFFFLPWW
jgi:hypothetical protein